MRTFLVVVALSALLIGCADREKEEALQKELSQAQSDRE